LIDDVATEIQVQLKSLSRSEKMQAVLTHGFAAIEVGTPTQMAEIANYVAPEHLQLMVAENTAKKLLKEVTTAGAILLGNHTPTALGDFTAGPSHVLPTGRTGRFFSGLRVADFMRRTSVVKYTPASVKKGNEVVAAFAAMERLDAHGRSVKLRA
jgi:histidinol dehydrogenase